jgi:hypothetical protein
MQRLAEGFANERSGLGKQWDRGDNVSTEELRVALQRYRSFFLTDCGNCREEYLDAGTRCLREDLRICVIQPQGENR